MTEMINPELARKHSMDVVRNVGVMTIFALILLNGAGGLIFAAQSKFFLAGLVAAFLAVVIVYVLSMLEAAEPSILRDLPTVCLLALMVGPSAASFFCLLIGMSELSQAVT